MVLTYKPLKVNVVSLSEEELKALEIAVVVKELDEIKYNPYSTYTTDLLNYIRASKTLNIAPWQRR